LAELISVGKSQLLFSPDILSANLANTLVINASPRVIEEIKATYQIIQSTDYLVTILEMGLHGLRRI